MPDEWGHESILLLQLSRIPNCATFLFDGRVFHKCSISDFHGDIERLHVRRLRSSNGLARLAAALTATLRPHTSGTAVASLVMGILSFIPGFLILTGIPGAIVMSTGEKKTIQTTRLHHRLDTVGRFTNASSARTNPMETFL